MSPDSLLALLVLLPITVHVSWTQPPGLGAEVSQGLVLSQPSSTSAKHTALIQTALVFFRLFKNFFCLLWLKSTFQLLQRLTLTPQPRSRSFLFSPAAACPFLRDAAMGTRPSFQALSFCRATQRRLPTARAVSISFGQDKIPSHDFQGYVATFSGPGPR